MAKKETAAEAEAPLTSEPSYPANMNVYARLLEARRIFHSKEITKSGWNDYSKYHYFQLADFVKELISIFQNVGLLSHVWFTKEMAYMDIININNPNERITFSSPMAGAQLKGTHEIQQIGAVETYQRRYLYLAALDIVEHDGIDSAVAYDDAFTRMKKAKDLRELQSVFADEYQATTDKKEKADLKSEYDKLKKQFIEKEGGAE